MTATSEGPGHVSMHAVTMGKPGLVAVGNTTVDEGWPDAAVWTSPDGRAWSRGAHDDEVFGGPYGEQMWSVVETPDGLVAAGTSGWGSDGDMAAAVWRSSDGHTWERIEQDDVFTSGRRRSVHSLILDGPGLIAGGVARVSGTLGIGLTGTGTA